MTKIHAEGGTKGGERQEHSDEHVEAMTGGEEFRAVLRLFFGLARDHVFETVFGIGMKEFDSTLNFDRLVACNEDIAVVGESFAGLLEGGVHVAGGAEQRRGDLENLEKVF